VDWIDLEFQRQRQRPREIERRETETVRLLILAIDWGKQDDPKPSVDYVPTDGGLHDDKPGKARRARANRVSR